MAKSRDLLGMILSSPRETDSFGQTMGTVLRGGDVLALVGELGAGKTALVRGIVAGLGGSASAVTSPTFMLMHEYQGGFRSFILICTDCSEPRKPRRSDSRLVFQMRL